MDKDNIGKLGETLAADFLKNKNYEILAQNWTFKHEEIDIIALKNKILVVVEVKTRSAQSAAVAEPFLAITREKQRHLIQAANAFIEKNFLDVEVRFDIISVIIAGEKHIIEHIEDAFYPILKK